jgi:glutamyl-tRNA(Gln) amidotransferase subunit E
LKPEPNNSAGGPRPPGDLNPRTDTPLDFPDRDLGELTPEDYRALGFMSGLEVHQQVLTRGKLFCRCPAGRDGRRYDAEVLRHMRPTLSELGEYDGTALMEFKTNKEIVYRLERGSVCTYEIDDTPPFEIDDEAVRVALEVALLLNLNLVSELHVMRKQYLDGSIPTGFQRTAMLGLDGVIPFRAPEIGVSRELRIRQLSLEEDSCREVSDVGHRITFRTDRLGMPLIETVTEPDLLTPFEVQAAGRLIARVAQATGKARRGPGAARQDVNVSVAGGRRIELKGVDNHRFLPLLVHTEAYRQLNLLRIRHELHRRGVEPELLSVPDKGHPWELSPGVIDAGPVLRGCDFEPLRNAIERGETVCALRLPGFGGLLGHATQPGVTFAREIADRGRVIACLEDRPFLIHSDLTDYGLSPGQWRRLRRRLWAERGDTVVVLWGPARDAATAVREVYIRAREALVGVPAETRQAYPDGTNGFERILPGPDRMYPDTDTPPVPIPDRIVGEIRSSLPESPWGREERYRKLGLDSPTAARLAGAPWARLFDALDPAPGATARRLAHALGKRLPYHRRSRGLDSIPAPERVAPLVSAVASGRVRAEAMEPALDALREESERGPEEVLTRFSRGEKGASDLEEAIRVTAAAGTALAGRSPEVVMRWAMGRVMPRLLGRVDPAEVRARLMKALSPVLTGVTS